MSSVKSKILGIDLGTTNSAISIIDNVSKKTIKTIENKEGKRTTPSVVSFDEQGNYTIGEIAKRQAYTNPKNTIFAFKRFMGRKYDEVRDIASRLPFKVVSGKNGDAYIEVNGKPMSPIEISAKFLIKLVEIASNYTGQPVQGTEVVITVPAYFNQLQRQATKDAGEIAGLKVARIINEPTAAALAYGLDKINDNKEMTILVYDVGGGTFDVSILKVDQGVFEVLGTGGDSALGGEDFDNAIMDHVCQKFNKLHPKINILKDPAALYRILKASNMTKEELSTVLVSNVSVPYITADSSGPINLEVKITRNELNALISKKVNATKETVEKVMQEAKVSSNDIDLVICAGGSTRIVAILDLLINMFGKEKVKQDVNPDEVVCQGAALQGAIIFGDLKDVLLLDVSSLSLGIESLGGIHVVILPKGSTLPTKQSKMFTTHADNQTTVLIQVYFGESKFTNKCVLLGTFELTGIKPAPKGTPRIEVTFDLDVNGILEVTAVDKDTGNSKSVHLHPEVGISQEEKDRMTEEAKRDFEEESKKEKSIVAKYELESTVYNINKEKGEIKNISSETNDKIEQFVTEANKLISSEETLDCNVYTECNNKGLEIIRELYGLKKENEKNNTQNNSENNDQDNTNNKNNNEHNATPENTEETTDQKSN